jgi:glycine/D-amino acid oxidase-like deaminating enzyme
MTIRYGLSPWLAQPVRSRRPAYPRFTGQLEPSVVIVGGGVAGCATAYTFAAAGVRVALVEADRLGAGATGSSGGLLLTSPGADFLALDTAYGLRAARSLWQDMRRAALDAAATLRRLNIKCGLTPVDTLIHGSSPEEIKVLRREVEALRKAGLDAVWLPPRSVARSTGLESGGGVRLHASAMLDPYRAVVGLARAAATRGATIYEKSPVDSIKFGRRGVEVRVGKGALQAQTVVIATGEPTTLFRALKRHFQALETYLVLTPPLGAAVRKTAGMRDAIVEDRHVPPHRLCWTPDGRVLWSGGDQPRTPPRTRDAVLVQRTGQLMYELSLALPAISGVQPEFGWNAPYSRTVDGVPFLGAHRNYPHHLFALGLGANLSAAFLASRLLLRQFAGTPDKGDEYFGFTRLGRH